MNGLLPTSNSKGPHTALTGVETAHQSIGSGAIQNAERQEWESHNNSQSQDDGNSLSKEVGSLRLGESTTTDGSSENGRQGLKTVEMTQMELELQ